MAQLSIKSQIPNALTILRMILVIPIIVLAAITWNEIAYTIIIDSFNITIFWKNIVLFILFVIASISDWLDGYLSRKYHWISNFGKIMDPIADKVLVNSMLIILSIQNLTHFIFVILFIARDTIVDALRMYIANQNVIIAANFYGKLKTVLQMLAIIWLLLLASSNTNYTWWYWGMQQFPIYLALLASLFSGYKYVFDVLKVLKNKQNLKA